MNAARSLSVSVRGLLALGFVTRCRCLRLLDGVAKNSACSSLSMYLRAVVTSVCIMRSLIDWCRVHTMDVESKRCFIRDTLIIILVVFVCASLCPRHCVCACAKFACACVYYALAD